MGTVVASLGQFFDFAVSLRPDSEGPSIVNEETSLNAATLLIQSSRSISCLPKKWPVLNPRTEKYYH